MGAILQVSTYGQNQTALADTSISGIKPDPQFRCILIYVGWRFIRTREIPVTSEGSNTSLWWISGKDAVFAGVVVIALGIALLAIAGGILQLP